MQELAAPKASAKVAAVLWTRRSDRYTLQVIFFKETAFPGVGPAPTVTLWLLGANGTFIPASRSPISGGVEKNGPPSEVTYTATLAEGEQAVAAVLKLDDAYYVDALQPLK